jgi:hypothetical protein
VRVKLVFKRCVPTQASACCIAASHSINFLPYRHSFFYLENFMASNTLFLDLVAIKGNSYHQKFVGMVGLNSYSHSASQNLTDDPTNATRTSGKANAFNFNFTKHNYTIQYYKVFLF